MSDNDPNWLDSEFEGIDDIEAFRNQRGFTMRHPALLLAVLAGSIFLGYKTWPKAAYFFAQPTDCGVLIDRPIFEAKEKGSAPPLIHNTFCKLKGINEQLSALATAKKDGEQPFKGGNLETKADLSGVKYYVKLAGANVVGVLPADREDIMRFRERKGGLTGFEFDEPGRLIDVSQVPSLAKTARVLRIRWAIPDREPLYIFDLTDSPKDRWSDLLIVGLMALTALLAGFGLLRMARNRA